MRTSLLTRAAVVTAIAATTALAATGTADAASISAQHHPTSLSILAPRAGAKHANKGAKPASTAAAKPASTAAAKSGAKAAAKPASKSGSKPASKPDSKAVGKHRNKSVIRGVLKSGKAVLAREVVFLDRVAAGNKLTVAGKAITNKAGVAAFAVSRKAAGRYVLVFKGTGALSASHSAVVVVKAS